MTQKKMRLVLGSACLLAFVVPACSSDKKATSTGSGAPAVTTAGAGTTAGGGTTAPAGTTGAATAGGGMTISGFNFGATSVTAGQEFTITNNDSATHTVTDDGGTFDVSVPGGGTAKLTIPTAGTYKIHCKIHSAMHGTITAA
jgi:plastocyanin